uniref:Uncharacterized protein n=1 Tax=Setaria italica TaxID=4555 RepID=K3ZKU8_SETIT
MAVSSRILLSSGTLPWWMGSFLVLKLVRGRGMEVRAAPLPIWWKSGRSWWRLSLMRSKTREWRQWC